MKFFCFESQTFRCGLAGTVTFIMGVFHLKGQGFEGSELTTPW
jgi:hypothetical protein